MIKFIRLSIVLFLIISSKSYSQIGITYYSLDVISANFATKKVSNITGELKISTNNREMDGFPIELDLFYRFKRDEQNRFSIGVAFKTDPITGNDSEFLIPITIEVYPFQEFKNVSFVLEFAPEIILEEQRVLIRSLVGLRYTFGNNF